MAKGIEFISSIKKLYEKSSKTDPFDLFTEALAVGFEDDYKQAIEIIDEALLLNESANDPEKKSLFLVFKAMALNRLGRDSDGLECVEEAIEVNEKDSFGWNIKGDLYHAMEKYEEALEAYENSVKYSDKEELAESLLDKAEILGHLDRNEEALKIVNESLELDPEDPDGWDVKSDVLVELGKEEEAFESTEKGLLIDPEHSDLLIDKGVLLMDMSKNEEALLVFNKVIQIDSSDELGWYNKACVLSVLNRKEDSLDALTVATSLDQENILGMKEEEDFDNIKNSERFNRLANQEV